jgi:hypothetical protein
MPKSAARFVSRQEAQRSPFDLWRSLAEVKQEERKEGAALQHLTCAEALLERRVKLPREAARTMVL